jgi:hypothetical protein
MKFPTFSSLYGLPRFSESLAGLFDSLKSCALHEPSGSVDDLEVGADILAEQSLNLLLARCSGRVGFYM